AGADARADYANQVSERDGIRASEAWDAGTMACANSAMCSAKRLPAVNGSVQEAARGQVGAVLRVLGGQLLVEVDAQSRGFARVEHAVLEAVGVREDPVRLLGVAHVLLDAEVVDGQVEVQGGGHADGGEVGGAVAARAHVEELGEGGDLAEVADA